MTAPAKAARLEIQHHDDRTTVYEDVHYWPYDFGGSVDILDASGNVLAQHRDVYMTLVEAPR